MKRDNNGKVIMFTANAILPPTIVKGHIADEKDKPIAMAVVQAEGSVDRALSDATGAYILSGIEYGGAKEESGWTNGKRTIVVSARGYADAQGNEKASSPVQFEKPGLEQTLDFKLKKIKKRK